MRGHLAFLVAFLILGIGVLPGPRSGMDLGGVRVFDVTQYGAVADATLATDNGTCGWLDDTDLNNPSCSVAGTGTDDSDAFDAAIDAAGAAGGGTVYVPCGDYRIGAATGGSIYTSGFFLDQDNVHIRGEGDCSRLLFNHDVGGALIWVCKNSDCSSGATVTGSGIHNLMLMDDDPEAHGHGRYSIVSSAAVTGVPASGDLADWDATASTGTVLRWDAANSTMRIRMDSGSWPDAADTIQLVGGAGWDITTLTIESAVTTEESHGIYLRYTEGVEIDHVHLRGFGDESIESMWGDNLRVHNNTLDHAPSIPGGGTGINIGMGSDYVFVYENFCDGGVKYYTGSGHDCFKFSTNTPDTLSSNAIIAHSNILVDTSSQGLGYIGTAVAIYSNVENYTISNLQLRGNLLLIGDDDITIPTIATAAANSTRAVSDLLIGMNNITGWTDLTEAGVIAPRFIGNSVVLPARSRAVALTGGDYAVVGVNTFRGNPIGLTCVYLNGMDKSVIGINTFSDCGGVNQIAIHELGSSNHNIAVGNITDEAGDDVRVGTLSIGGSDGDGVGAASLASTNVVTDAIVAADAPDCDTSDHGLIVKITDDTGVGNCAQTAGVLDGTGAATSTCICDGGAADWISLY